MAYQSSHTGQAIDDGISINSTQNTRLTTLENKVNTRLTTLENKVTVNTNDITALKNKTIPISQGGTGATSAEQALINLGISHIYYGTEEPSPSLGNDGDLYVCYRE